MDKQPKSTFFIKRVGVLSYVIPAMSFANCPSEQAVDSYVADFIAKRPNAIYTAEVTLDQAKCARSMFISRAEKTYGPAVGYKLALSNEEFRALNGIDEPVWGAMFKQGLLNSPADVPADYAAARWWESALMFRLKDANIAEAKTPLEALKSIEAVIPFVELTDYMSPNPPKTVHFFANNANFRAGVMGTEIPVKATRQTVKSLSTLKIVARDINTRTIYQQVLGSAVMQGNPLFAVMWLAQRLKADGVELKKGTLLSVSGMTSGVWAQSGQAVKVTYGGLQDAPSVYVSFK